MNKLITTLFIFSICYGISAQTEQGQFLMLGETSFQSTTTQPVIYSTIDGDTPDGFEASDYTVNNATATVGLGYLLTKNIPDPELLIRTGNTKRLSNFLLWQLAYSEIFFEKKLWTAFTEKDFNKIIKEYKNIKRNFGNI